MDNRIDGKAIVAAADDGGTIQAHQMIQFFADPTRHTTCNVETALRWAGYSDDEIAELLDRD